MKLAIIGFMLLPIATTSAQTQTADVFEVASVKPAPPREGVTGLTAMDADPAMVRYSNVSLKILIAIAYRFDSGLIQRGPAWLDDQLYDLAAKLPTGVSKDRISIMLQALLAERFKLVVHRETKDQRVCFLRVGKNGPMLKQAEKRGTEDSDVRQVRGDRLPISILPDRVVGQAISMQQFAGILTRPTGCQVVDRTGLAGVFDIDLRWSLEDNTPAGASIFNALQQQLGLRLEPGKAPVEVLVVDRAERIPVQN